MKKILIIIALLATAGAYAQGQGFGLGLILGEPTGISMKGWLSEDRAIDGAIAWSTSHGQSFHVHGDYLFHNYSLINVSKGRLPLYYGLGARLRVWEDQWHWHHGEWHEEDGRADLAMRFPVGLSYEFAAAPIDLFFELVPALGLMPDTYFDLDGGIGARYWF